MKRGKQLGHYIKVQTPEHSGRPKVSTKQRESGKEGHQV